MILTIIQKLMLFLLRHHRRQQLPSLRLLVSRMLFTRNPLLTQFTNINKFLSNPLSDVPSNLSNLRGQLLVLQCLFRRIILTSTLLCTLIIPAPANLSSYLTVPRFLPASFVFPPQCLVRWFTWVIRDLIIKLLHDAGL